MIVLGFKFVILAIALGEDAAELILIPRFVVAVLAELVRGGSTGEIDRASG